MLLGLFSNHTLKWWLQLCKLQINLIILSTNHRDQLSLPIEFLRVGFSVTQAVCLSVCYIISPAFSPVDIYFLGGDTHTARVAPRSLSFSPDTRRLRDREREREERVHCLLLLHLHLPVLLLLRLPLPWQARLGGGRANSAKIRAENGTTHSSRTHTHTHTNKNSCAHT